MKSVWLSIKQHPFSTIGLLLYLILYSMQIRAYLKFRAAVSSINNEEKIAWGEGIMYGYIIIFIIAIILLLLNAINGCLTKNNTFYLVLGGVTILSLIILWKI
jgi:hypothetical protein